MLGKLLKYDLKWIYKVVFVFYVLAFIFSVLGRALSLVENSVIFSVTTKIIYSFAIAMMINSLVNCIMRLWARFTRNIYKDESYLTHTLPVEKKTIFLSKVVSALVTIFTTTVVCVACLFICYYSKSNIEILKSLLDIAASTYNITVTKLLLLISVVILLEIIYIVLIGYVGIILGHKSNKNKMIRTIVIGFLLYMAMQTLTLVIIVIYGLVNPDVMNLVNTTDMVNIDAIKSVMYCGILIYVVYILFLYLLGKKQLESGVDVE